MESKEKGRAERKGEQTDNTERGSCRCGGMQLLNASITTTWCMCVAVLLPSPCAQTRVKEQRRKAFDEAQRKALADASAALQAATTSTSAAAGGGNGGSKKADSAAAAAATTADSLTAKDVAGASSSSSGPEKPAAAAAAAGSSVSSSVSNSKPGPGKSELEARVAYLQEAAKNYDDPGVCVVVESGLLGAVS